jgi:hypothetical protein
MRPADLGHIRQKRLGQATFFPQVADATTEADGKRDCHAPSFSVFCDLLFGLPNNERWGSKTTMNRLTASSLVLFWLLSAIGCRQGSSKGSDMTVAHAAEQHPSWYITDLGTKVIDLPELFSGISVDGMWYATSSIRDKQLIAPIAVKIDCSRPVKICRENDATVAMGILRPDTTDYTISIWNRDQLIAEDTDDGKCKITHRVVMDFKSQTVTLTDLPSQIDSKECKLYQDANSYILHRGQVMLFPPATYDPLAKK